ncbi:MAG TPA: peroxide stress protein YaaA [Burkholderiaceae bacterium]
MLLVISPAKTLTFEAPPVTRKFTQPDFLEQSSELITILRKKRPAQIAELMDLSPALAELNVQRYHDWQTPFDRRNARQAVLTFDGDVYGGLEAPTLGAKGIDYAQKRLRILSGLYGVLRPLDLMQAYRLEMGTRLANPAGESLYAFWGDRVTDALNAQVEELNAKSLVNLASDEYFRVVRPARLTVPVITPVFEDWKNGQYKIISFFAKRARGLMARYAALHGIRTAAKLKEFDLDGYAYCREESDKQRWVFRRRVAE